jgi:PAS domain-containing protein
MMGSKNSNAKALKLRRRSERRLARVHTLSRSAKSKADVARLLHELEIYRLELELQNESLREAQAQAQSAYDELYDAAPVGYFSFGRDGAIRRANLTGASVLGCPRDKLLGQRFASFVAGNSHKKFRTFLDRVFAANGKESCSVELMANDHALPAVAYMEAAAQAGDRECRVVLVDITSTA